MKKILGLLLIVIVALTGLGLVIAAYYLQPQSVGSGGKTREAV